MLRKLMITVVLAGSTSSLAVGNLMIVGGALRSDNAPIYNKFVELAGGKDAAKVVIFPTASGSLSSSKRFKADLEGMGLKPENVLILDLTRKNFDAQNKNPDLVKQVQNATAVWFVGGDQARVTKALFNKDQSDSLVLAAVRELFEKRDGVIGGSSAGASVQSALMPSSFGIPMDTLDFGVSDALEQRGVNVSKGLGFFKSGIVDQHFNTYQGRHARMVRYLLERKIPIGYGIDENTAMWVKPSGMVEVMGASGLTIMTVDQASTQDGPLGINIKNAVFSYLESGDVYNPQSGEYTINSKKSPIAPGDEYENGNRLVTDLSQPFAVNRLITLGLVDNTATTATGLYLRYNQNYSYGYKVTFSEQADTVGFYGSVAGVDGYAVRNVHMDIAPIAGDLRPSSVTTPKDLASSEYPQEVQTIVFRGMMLKDAMGRFNPKKGITRAELANALVYSTSLSLKDAPKLGDVPSDHPLASDIAIAVSRGYFSTDQGNFNPDQEVSRSVFAQAIKAAYEDYRADTLQGRSSATDLKGLSDPARAAIDAVVSKGLMSLDGSRFKPNAKVSREDVAFALYQLLGFQF